MEGERSEHVDHGQARTVYCRDDRQPTSWGVPGRVRRTDDSIRGFEIGPDLRATKGMIPECDRVGSRGEQPVGQARSYPYPVCRVLSVHDAGVDSELGTKPGQARLDSPSARAAHDVGDEENAQSAETR
jgi:hypothetical protein